MGSALGFELMQNQEDKFIWLKSGQLEILLRPGNNVSHTKNYYHGHRAELYYDFLYGDDAGIILIISGVYSKYVHERGWIQ